MNFFAAPLSKSLYPVGASSRVMTVAFTALADPGLRSGHACKARQGCHGDGESKGSHSCSYLLDQRPLPGRHKL